MTRQAPPLERMVWIEPPARPSGSPLHGDPLLDRLLAGRLADAAAVAEFLDPTCLPAPDPELLPGMTAAATRVAVALSGGEAIALFGDYDVDGVTSVALLAEALGAASGGVAPRLVRLPTRAEGYGLNQEAVAAIAAIGVSLLIAVDCGSGDHAAVAVALAAGLDVVVLDHHQMDGPGPVGAIVASAHLGVNGKYRELAAVGVAYLLAVALARRGFDLGRGPGREPVGLLDLVALGTVADVAPLTGVNRRLVRDGLRRLVQRPRLGLAELARRASLATNAITAEEIAFKLAPRLNAAGRMDNPRLAFDLLRTTDPPTATRLADELERLNRLRRKESARVIAEAEADLDQMGGPTSQVLVLSRPDWGNGVLGLAAGKLAERWGRPTLLLSEEGGVSRGSARSVPGFDIAHALAGCGDLLLSHGGHSQAAGVSLATADLPRLRAMLEAAVVAAGLSPVGPPELAIDADLPVERLEMGTAELLEALQPFGRGNPLPLLRVRNVALRSYTSMGQDGSHLKLQLATPRGMVAAVAWGAADRSRELLRQPAIDLVATVGIDRWNGQRRLHVEVKDWRPAGEPR